MADDVRFVEFFGERFAVPARFNSRLIYKLAAAAKDDVDSESMEGMALMNQLIESCLRPEDRDRFDDVCQREGPTDEELMEFTHKVMAAIAGRPTGRPSDSSDGSQHTSTSSAGASSSPAIDELHRRGRPDLALIVTQAQESRASA